MEMICTITGALVLSVAAVAISYYLPFFLDSKKNKKH